MPFSLKSLFGDENKGKTKSLLPIVTKINEQEASLEGLSDEQLRGKTEEFRGRLKDGENLEDILPEAFAVVREASKRTLGQRHFDVQLTGGILLHRKSVIEMRTGEGKTLVATLPMYLNAIEGKGVHLVTVNDYLARRDAQWMGQIYAFLGMSVGIINSGNSYLYDPGHKEVDEDRDKEGSYKVFYEFLKPCNRQDAYKADITYGTNSEFGFDYLRDNLSYDPKNVVQGRGGQKPVYNFAIIDEVDSILIDEARTPLIISAPVAESESLYNTFARIAENLKYEEHYEVDEKLKAISLTDEGINKAEEMLGVSDIYTEKGIKYVHHLETAVRAKALFNKEKEYVVKDGVIVIVDEFTGRLQSGRRWSEGLHQAIEAKEGVTVQQESRTFATITYQNYFRLYDNLSGMTGTALTSKEEFFKVYGLDTVAVPTNKPIERIDLPDLIFQTEKGKFQAISRIVKEINETGQPILIGTASIEKNEMLSVYLKKEGIAHAVLNAKRHEEEGQIIAGAGRRGSVVIATNMAGRGVDIKLGGTNATEGEAEEVRGLGGLFVLGTERHEARRIDNQLRGRSGRQGDPGKTQFFLSLEDALMRVFASDRIKNMMGRFGIPEDEAIQNKIVSKSVESAQEKIEGFHFDSRKQILEYDDVLNQQRSSIYNERGTTLFGTKEEIDQILEEAIGEVGEAEGKTEEINKVLEEKRGLPEEVFYADVRRMILQIVDMLWVEHLEAMDYMRSSVRLRAYGQRDPLVEYKKEGLLMFRDLEWSAKENIVKMLPNVGAGFKQQEERGLKEVHENASVISGTKDRKKVPVKDEKYKDVGRNDTCPCGSGKKFKKCHG